MQTFFGNIGIDHTKKNVLKPHVKARFIRYIPEEWDGDFPCMRVEAYECVPRKGNQFYSLFCYPEKFVYKSSLPSQSQYNVGL